MTTRPLALLCLALACSAESVEPSPPPGPPAPELGCGGLTSVALAAGESVVFDVGTSASCIRLPSGQVESEYVVAAYSASSATTPEGVYGPYRLRSRGAIPAGAGAEPVSFGAPDGPSHFHGGLRERERRLALRRTRPAATSPLQAAPPAAGEQRTFSVCATPTCTTFAPVMTSVAFVGAHVALMVDSDMPSGGFSPAELVRLGRLFDEQIHPIATEAFGAESDIDGNGVVFVVMTPQVNRLCPQLGGVALGYFYGLDLLPGEAGSNGREVFYMLVPDPEAVAGCRVTKDVAEWNLPGTLIHEFQHMISYNQHVLVRGGPPEEHWLNEGLSHLAEEIGARRIPNASCVSGDCFSQFAFNDVSNAYWYLFATESSYLLFPEGTTGRLAERGAAWLFVRWLTDHFGAGDAFTRSLVRTNKVGAENIGAATAADFGTLLGEWQLSLYLDDLPGFTPKNPRLSYLSWNWRTTLRDLRTEYPFSYPKDFPLEPDHSTGTYERTGTLRGGSGRHLLVTVPARGQPADLRLTDPSGTEGVLPSVAARIAVARIR